MGGISEKVECGMTIKHEKRQEQNAAMGRRDHKRWMQCSLRKHGKMLHPRFHCTSSSKSNIGAEFIEGIGAKTVDSALPSIFSTEKLSAASSISGSFDEPSSAVPSFCADSTSSAFSLSAISCCLFFDILRTGFGCFRLSTGLNLFYRSA